MEHQESKPAHARLEAEEGVITVTFTRDAQLNAIGPEITRRLWEAVRLMERDEFSALVIQAEGRYFSAGLDLGVPFPAAETGSASEFRRLYRRHHLLYDELEALEKPVFLAAQGPCLGAGVELAGSCDFRFVASGAYFQLPEIGRGTIAGSGGVSRITRLVGPHWAKWIAMAGQRIDAERALSIGLVHEVMPVEGFHQTVRARVREIAQLPAEALAASKLAIDAVTDVDRTTARHIERLANGPLVMSGAYGAGDRAFRRK